MGFTKNDESFICLNCNKKVEKLKYTSRDHCNHCLYSVHVDIEPGDRLNECKGKLVPINIIQTAKKGKVIEYANPKTFITINRKNNVEFKNLNSVIGMDFENDSKRIYQFGIKIFEI